MKQLLVFVILLAAAPMFGAGMLSNGDFRAGLSDWHVPSAEEEAAGRKVSLAVDPQIGPHAEITSSDREKSTYMIQRLNPQELRGKTLMLSFRLKLENVRAGKFSHSNARVLLIYRTRDGRDVETAGTEMLGSTSWQNIVKVGRIPDDAVSVALFVGMHTTTGTVRFADCRLAEIDPRSGLKIAPGVEEFRVAGVRVLKINGRYFTERTLPQPEKPLIPTRSDLERGFILFRPAEPAEAAPERRPGEGERLDGLRIRATRGEVAIACFAVFSLKDIAGFTATPGELKSGSVTLPAEAEVFRGRPVFQRTGFVDNSFHLTPKLLEKIHPFPLPKNNTALCMFMLRIPQQARPGNYSGSLAIAAEGMSARIPVELEVLPFELSASGPWMFFYYGGEPKPAAHCFSAMREYGATSVILAEVNEQVQRTGSGMSMTTGRSDALMELCRKNGFSPVVYNPFHDRLATLLIRAAGLEKNYPSERAYGQTVHPFPAAAYPGDLKTAYRQLMVSLRRHAEEKNWPRVLFFPVDEPGDAVHGGSNWRFEAAKLEYALAKPEFRTFCTAYRLPTINALSPNLDVTTIPLSYLERPDSRPDGKIPEVWGIDWPAMRDDFNEPRLNAGLRPATLNCAGMTAWTYYPPRRFNDEYMDLRQGEKNCLLAYENGDGSLIPTLPLEGIRAGITDRRYAETLRELARNDSAAGEDLAKIQKKILASARPEEVRAELIDAIMRSLSRKGAVKR